MTDAEMVAPAVGENVEKEETPMTMAPVPDDQQASSSSTDATSANKETVEEDTLSSTAD
uniref:Uncharacterized protein n=1 Tax=Steinernema glaseri TaxID=37863 RepID=A0A1I7Z0T0_9BILA